MGYVLSLFTSQDNHQDDDSDDDHSDDEMVCLSVKEYRQSRIDMRERHLMERREREKAYLDETKLKRDNYHRHCSEALRQGLDEMSKIIKKDIRQSVKNEYYKLLYYKLFIGNNVHDLTIYSDMLKEVYPDYGYTNTPDHIEKLKTLNPMIELMEMIKSMIIDFGGFVNEMEENNWKIIMTTERLHEDAYDDDDTYEEYYIDLSYSNDSLHGPRKSKTRLRQFSYNRFFEYSDDFEDSLFKLYIHFYDDDDKFQEDVVKKDNFYSTNQ